MITRGGWWIGAAAAAKGGHGGKQTKQKATLVQYRGNALTELMQDSLGNITIIVYVYFINKCL